VAISSIEFMEQFEEERVTFPFKLLIIAIAPDPTEGQ